MSLVCTYFRLDELFDATAYRILHADARYLLTGILSLTVGLEWAPSLASSNIFSNSAVVETKKKNGLTSLSNCRDSEHCGQDCWR